MLYSARGAVDYTTLRRRLGRLPWLPADRDVPELALEIQWALARRGHHRVAVPDLLIAATAIVHGATVLHFDRDFDTIAEVSVLSAEWIVPRPRLSLVSVDDIGPP